MKVGIDAREIKNSNTGVGTYVLNLIKALGDIDHENEYFLFVDSDFNQIPKLSKNFKFCTIKSYLNKKVQDQYEIVRNISKYKLDVFHVTHHDVVPLFTNIPLVITVHDIAWLDIPSNSSIFQIYYYCITRLAMRKARVLLAVSKSTKVRIKEHFRSAFFKTTAIQIACDPYYYQISTDKNDIDNLCKEFNLSIPYILYVGSFAKRKNLSLLFKAMNIVCKNITNVQLVIAGKASGNTDTDINIRKGNDLNLISISRNKTLAELKYLYQNAAMLVFPSVNEGFGLPVLEAMACGCPVIASNTTSLPEILGDSGILINPYDECVLADQIVKVLQNPHIADQMRKDGKLRAIEFNWKKVALETIDNYRLAINN